MHICKCTKFCEVRVPIFPYTAVIWRSNNIQVIKNCLVVISSLLSQTCNTATSSLVFIPLEYQQYNDALINALTQVLKKFMHALTPLKIFFKHSNDGKQKNNASLCFSTSQSNNHKRHTNKLQQSSNKTWHSCWACMR